MTVEMLKMSSLLDQAKLGGFQRLIVTLCATVLFLDGFDAQAIGYVAPALLDAHVVTPGQLGPTFAAGLVGLMVGALFVAPLADKAGRRPVILVSTLIFGGFSLATAWSTDFSSLVTLRFLTGIGLGGCMPNAIALTSEYAPSRRRGFLVSTMFAGFTLGSLLGGLISARLVPSYGWHGVFVVGGVLPLLLAPILFLLMPESLRFVARRPDGRERAVTLARRIAPDLDADAAARLILDAGPDARGSVRQLLAPGRVMATLLLWSIFFLSLLDVYMLVNWLPTLLKQSGASMRAAILIGSVLQLGALIGAFPLGALLDRKGPATGIAVSYSIGAVSIAAAGVFAGISLPLTVVAVFFAGFGIIGGQGLANAIASIVYPTQIRSTGVGWALGVGRVGSIVGPLVGGLLRSMDVTPRDILLLSAIPATVVVVLSRALKTGHFSAANEPVPPPHDPAAG